MSMKGAYEGTNNTCERYLGLRGTYRAFFLHPAAPIVCKNIFARNSPRQLSAALATSTHDQISLEAHLCLTKFLVHLGNGRVLSFGCLCFAIIQRMDRTPAL
jgi:hypothetical protein